MQTRFMHILDLINPDFYRIQTSA